MSVSTIAQQKVVFLEGKRLYLRPLLESDLPYFIRWFNDHDGTLDYLGSPIPNTEAGERDWIARQKQDKQVPTDLVFMVVVKKGDRPIGTMGLHRISWIDRLAFTGTAIGEHSYRNKGYASEAKELLLRFAFCSLGLNRIASTVNSTNGRSIAYSKKCGYVIEGVDREAKFSKGRFIDSVRMSILRSDWDTRQKKIQAVKR